MLLAGIQKKITTKITKDTKGKKSRVTMEKGETEKSSVSVILNDSCVPFAGGVKPVLSEVEGNLTTEFLWKNYSCPYAYLNIFYKVIFVPFVTSLRPLW